MAPIDLHLSADDEGFDGVHGAQWVGPYGAIGGLITDQSTGAAVPGCDGQRLGRGTASDVDGRYLLDGLGPYEWTVFYLHRSYGGQWSGGGPNRLAAERIRVRVGQTTPYDVGLRAGTTLTGRITGPAGVRPPFGLITVYHARTFDVMGQAVMRADGTYSVQLLGPQDVKLLVETAFNGRPLIRWYDNATDFSRARTVRIPSSGTKTVDIAVG